MFHCLGLLFRFLYHFLFIDQKDGSLSYTKFFSIIGYGLWCWAFPYTVIHGSQASFELWMVFGTVVIGNHTLQTVMLNKAGVRDEASTWKGKYAAGQDNGDDVEPVVAPPVVPAPSVPAPPPKMKVPDTKDLLG